MISKENFEMLTKGHKLRLLELQSPQQLFIAFASIGHVS